MNPIAAISISSSAVLVTGIVSHAFHSWLRQRERERLTATEVARLDKHLDELDKWKLEIKMALANGARR